MAEYSSSEDLQRAALNKAQVFADTTKPATRDTTDRDRVKRMIDKYIQAHSSAVMVRAVAKEYNRTADYQLDLSADIVEILTKIKSELR